MGEKKTVYIVAYGIGGPVIVEAVVIETEKQLRIVEKRFLYGVDYRFYENRHLRKAQTKYFDGWLAALKYGEALMWLQEQQLMEQMQTIRNHRKAFTDLILWALHANNLPIRVNDTEPEGEA